MKIKQWAMVAVCLLATVQTVGAQSLVHLWKQVAQAEKKSLPETVIRLTSDIYRRAEAEKNAPQMLKAYTWRMHYRETLEPDSLLTDVQGLEQWAARTVNPVDRAVLHSLLAACYLQLRPLSLAECTERVNGHIDAALKDSALLLRTSTEAFAPFIEPGKASGTYYHHNLYQLLATRALDDWKSLGWRGTEKRVNFRIEALYRHLLAADRACGLTDGYVLTMLDYLDWRRASDGSFGPYRAPKGLIGRTQDPYLAGLDKLVTEFGDCGIAAEVYLAKAVFAVNAGLPATALQFCEEAVRRYPRYSRIGALKNLKQDILQPQLNVNTPQTVYPADSLKLSVNHRNLDGFTLRLRDVKSHRLAQQHFALYRPADYLPADTTFSFPMPGEGTYRLQLIPDAKVSKQVELPLFVTRFKVLTRALPAGRYELLALDACSGRPIGDATLTLFSADDQPVQTLVTDAAGSAVLPWNPDYRQVKAQKGTDTASPLQRLNCGYYFFDSTDRSAEEVTLLTDRTLYRPGQSVHVKGIAYRQQNDTANVIARCNYTLTLLDANRQEVASRELLTNDFGSFVTTFTLPAACLNGNFTLQTTGGSTAIRVEEYKRPTFDLTFNSPAAAYQLGDSVLLKGSVRGFSGAALQNLPLKYTVTRALRFGWRMPQQSEDPIASGTVLLNEEGAFAIPVQLAAATGSTAFGYYRFTVEATVTSLSGETQSATYTLSAGDRSLLLGTDLPEQLCKDDTLRAVFSAVNLNDEPVAVDGTWRLFPFADGSARAKVSPQAVRSGTFVANRPLCLDACKSLPSGAYQLLLEAKDDQGRQVEYKRCIVLFAATDNRPPADSPMWYTASNTSFDAAHPACFNFGTSLKDAYVRMDVFCGDRQLENRVLQLSDSLVRFDYPYQQRYGNGLTVSFCFVKNGTVYRREVELRHRLPSKALAMKWDVFRDKLRPGQQEEWRLTLRTPQALPAAAEMLATLYDASLDKLWRQRQTLQLFYRQPLPAVGWMTGYAADNSFYYSFPQKNFKVPERQYDHFTSPDEIRPFFAVRGNSRMLKSSAAIMNDAVFEKKALNEPRVENLYAGAVADRLPVAPAELRTNLAETAFFYPQLRTNEQGEISFAFTMPQSLTRWNFRGYAHTRGMLTGELDAEATTSKELMLTPNLPRFVRTGDHVMLASSVTNLTAKDLSGTVAFTLFDPLTDKVISKQKETFAVAAGKSTAVCFAFTASERYELLGCRLVADAGTFSDGEQQLLPVLSPRVNLTETVPLFVKGAETQTFALDALFNRHSPSATHRRLTVEFTGNPAWYAVLALPTLAQPATDNAIDWAAGYYANTLAAFILNSQPRLRAMVDSWKQQGGTKKTFLSNLQKNQALKSILLSESPWVMEARTEQQQQERIATLFDLNTLRLDNLAALAKLKELQRTDGSWAWYRGMSGSLAVTQFIVETNARLAALTGQPLAASAAMQQAAFGYLHQQITKSKPTLEYLYLLAISGEKMPAANAVACRAFQQKLVSRLPALSMSEKAMAAIVFAVAGEEQPAQEFIASIKEHLSQSHSLSTQVLVMEALGRVGETALYETLKSGLLARKRTQQWDSPVATVNAVYALLNRGSNLIAPQGDVCLTLGGETIETLSPAQGALDGLGYVEQTFTEKKLVEAPSITVQKRDAGIAWGAVYAQYLEDFTQVKPQGNGLSLQKQLFVERLVADVRQWQPLAPGTPLIVGDKVLCRLTLQLDRPMQFVQLTDAQAACLEPLASLSGFRWMGGTGGYADVKDASVRFFFDHLIKGTHIVESAYRVTRSGSYSSGISTLQSAYAPEFVAHAGAVQMLVK
ncbi:MAG: alpha-2-macroglobulin family protein [Bacteroides sp.]